MKDKSENINIAKPPVRKGNKSKEEWRKFKKSADEYVSSSSDLTVWANELMKEKLR